MDTSKKMSMGESIAMLEEKLIEGKIEGFVIVRGPKGWKIQIGGLDPKGVTLLPDHQLLRCATLCALQGAE